jgi:ankyrin repeat protein
VRWLTLFASHLVALRQGHKEVVELLLSRGANAVARDKNGLDVKKTANNKGFKEIEALIEAAIKAKEKAKLENSAKDVMAKER